MNFHECFLTHLLSNSQITSAISINQFLPAEIPLKPYPTENILSLLASGYIRSFFPYQYEMENFPSFCIFLTIKGSGVYETAHAEQILTPGTLLFMDCQKRHKIFAKKNNWEFYQLFLETTGSSYFYKQFTLRYGNVSAMTLTPYILSLLNRLTAFPQAPDRDILFVNHRLLTDFLTAALLKNTEYSDDTAPSYLKKMKEIMDTQYSAHHSLSQFEETLGVSKYRLSKEFHNLYQAPPMQYLNRHRIKESKKLLQDPSMTVYEAGRLVGIDNTSHFIHLFQKYMGTTPAKYRRSFFT